MSESMSECMPKFIFQFIHCLFKIMLKSGLFSLQLYCRLGKGEFQQGNAQIWGIFIYN